MASYSSDSSSGWGVSHLGGTPITLSFGAILFGALLLLIILRVAFASVDIRTGVK